MNGTKALYFEEHCRARGQAYLRFDYSGHGASDGNFEDGTIGSWAQDAIFMLDNIVRGPALLVGSSMGGWMAFLVARARPKRIHSLIGIAAAPDFTEDIYERLPPDLRADLHANGFAAIPNDYSDTPYHFPLAFYEEAKAHHVLNGAALPDIPMHLFQGGKDLDVLPDTPARIQAALTDHTITVSMIDDGDHRLSRPQDLALIESQIAAMSA